jgi:hypothetical protein
VHNLQNQLVKNLQSQPVHNLQNQLVKNLQSQPVHNLQNQRNQLSLNNYLLVPKLFFRAFC